MKDDIQRLQHLVWAPGLLFGSVCMSEPEDSALCSHSENHI